MPTVPIGLAGPSYVAPSIIASDDRTINFFPEFVETERGISQLVLTPTPGLVQWLQQRSDANVGRSRGQLTLSNGLMVWVAGMNVYTITTTPTATLRGTVTDDGNPVFMFANLVNQVVIISGGLGYVLNTSTMVLTQITDVDFPNTLWAGFLDQYAIALRNTAQQFFITLGDALVWDALEFTTLESGEDTQVAGLVNRAELWFFGEKLTNIYYDSGNADFSFDKRPGGIIEIGCGAAYSPSVIPQVHGGGIVWLAVDRAGYYSVVRATGYDPSAISDNAIEFAINGLGTKSDARGFVQGRFYWLTFPTSNRTFVYDLKFKKWHERLYYNELTTAFEAHRAVTYAFFAGKHIVGDRATGTLYELSDTTYTDQNGSGSTNTLVRERTAPHIVKPGRSAVRAIHKALRLYMEVGVGLDVVSTTLGYDPQVMLRFSNDGGKSWDQDWISVSAGKVGEYRAIAEWRQLGSTNIQRTYAVRVTDPVPWKLMEAYIDVE